MGGNNLTALAKSMEDDCNDFIAHGKPLRKETLWWEETARLTTSPSKDKRVFT